MPMPRPGKGESEKDFVGRFMKETASEYPDEKQRTAVAYAVWRKKDRVENEADTWPKTFCCRFIEPGLVNYKDLGTLLVQKPALDKMAMSFVGKPVINEVHKDVDPSIYEEGEADGIVTRVWYEPGDGWYWCEFLVWDTTTRRNCMSDGYSVSCAYEVAEFGAAGGTHHDIAYEREILDGRYTHLAVVSNPRYEGARIVYNSKGGHMFKLFGFGSKKEKVELKNITGAAVEIDGKRVPVKDLIDLHGAEESRKAALANAGEPLSEDTLVEVDGKEMPLKNLMDLYREKRNADEEEERKKKDAEAKAASDRKNAEDEEARKKKEAEEKAAADRKNAEDAAEKKRQEEEARKNAEDAEKKKKEEDELKNAKDQGARHFEQLAAAAALRGAPQAPLSVTRREMAEAGKKAYGSSAE